MKRSLWAFLWILMIVFTATDTYAQEASIHNGLSYLHSTQSPDGSWGGAASSTIDIIPATATVVETFRLLESAPSSQQLLGRGFLTNQTLSETDYIARRILALAGTTSVVAADQTALLSLQNKAGTVGFASDNGWGGLAGYGSTLLDSSLALQAFAALGYTDATVIAPSVGYLVSKQNPDGGWGFVAGQSSHPYTTALALKALSGYASQYALNTPIQNAVNYLLSQQTAPGDWENTIYLTALAYIGLHDFIPQEPTASAVKNVLASRQLPNGSWGDDPYQTALAIRALALAETLPANPTLAIIRGRVIDAQTGQPLSGVAVGLTGPVPDNRVTVGDGLFEFRDLTPGAYAVALSLVNYGSLNTNTTVAQGQVIDLGTLQMTQGATAATGTVTGTIFDGETGLPLEGVAISIDGGPPLASTAADGSYQISNAPAGTILLSALRAGYITTAMTATLQPGGHLVFSPNLYPGISASLTLIQGVVTSAVTGLPLEGVVISLSGATSGFATTNAEGRYTIAVQRGVITITASLADYDTVTAETNVHFNNVTIFSPKLYPANTTPPGENTAGVTGLVLDAGTNQPLANVTVAATYRNGSQTLTTGPDGRFLVEGLIVWTTDLQFTLSGYAANESSAVLNPLQTVDIGQVRMRKEKVVLLLPDLAIRAIDRTGLLTDPQTLALTGALTAIVSNLGTATASSGIDLLAFQDTNLNGVYDFGADTLLGRTTLSTEIIVGGEAAASIPLQGSLSFLDAPIHLWIDSAKAIVELDEGNNIATTADHCVAVPDIRTFSPVLKWAWRESTILPNHRQVMSIPIVAPLEDTNGDGKIDSKDIPAVIFHAFQGGLYDRDGVLRAVSGKDGQELWTVTDPAYRTNGTGSIAVADIDEDGRVEIIVPANGGGVLAFEHDGTFKWKSPQPALPGWGGAAVADLEGDGQLEIMIGHTVLNSDGTLRWRGGGSDGSYLSIAADLDLDGTLEVIAGSTAYSNTGQILWRNPAADGFAAVANFNDDPYPEVVGVGNSRVALYSHTGATIWGPVLVPGAGGGMPTIGDIDGDGLPEIGVAGASRYVVFTADGSILWTSPTQDLSSKITGSSAFDFDGDGQVEVVYADEKFLRVYRGSDGALIFQTPNTSGTAYELPVIADVDSDNHADIVVAINNYYLSGFGSGIRVYRDQNNSWVNTRKIWNQHSYHITNINDDGTVPTAERNSWEVHNSYRLNALIDESPIAAPDLTASLLQVIDHGTGQAVSLRVRIGNGGAFVSPEGVLVAFYQGDPASGGTLLGTKEIGSLLKGAYQDVVLDGVSTLTGGLDLYAVVDPENRILECGENNNIARTALAANARLGTIQPATDAAVYPANAPVQLSALITNTGALSGRFTVELRVEDGEGAVVAGFGVKPLGLLAGGAAVTSTEEWNTAAILAGSYRLHGFLRREEGLLLSEATIPFEIRSVRQAAATIHPDKIAYASNEAVALSSTITSQTVNDLLTNLTATVRVTDPSGGVFFIESKPLADLLPEGRAGFKSFTNTGTAPAGTYTATLEIQSGGNLLTTATQSFEILSSLSQAAALSGEIAADPRRILERESTTLTFTVRNIGNEIDLPLIETSILIVDPDTETPVRTLPGEVSLNGREVFIDRIPFESGILPPKPYLIVLQGTTAGVTQTLGSAGLQIDPVPNHAPLADAGPDRLGLTGQPVLLDGSGSADPDGDPLTFAWHFIAVPPTSQVTDAALANASTPAPSFVSDADGTYTLRLVVNDGLTDSPQDTVSVFVNPAPHFDLHPETINLKSNGGSKSVTGVLTSPVLSAFAFFTAQDGATVTASFTLENRYVDQDGNVITFTLPADAYPGDDTVHPVDADGDGDVDLYQLTLKFNRDLIIAGFKDANGNLKISQPTDLISTVFGNDLVIGSDTNEVISPPQVSKGGK
ncbi:carboxypeptidase-like regulatory domain-containing protein [Candidatus Manganitrophus noduliformans]|uniref:Uncharacterized protein n=1 Tax=Candidatus Manganitrophus noduliformans TaxID=2606439 RepID=A0A7X6ID54_9BACT|nr:carboxypeptidase regulatory-like domain-containing protein [Candidatus Manganitrophus noduliformans]NKE73373.1 hypothetical protein [Candidatus Manganitrophus noduliformans]